MCCHVSVRCSVRRSTITFSHVRRRRYISFFIALARSFDVRSDPAMGGGLLTVTRRWRACRTMPYHAIPRHTITYHGISWHTMAYYDARCSRTRRWRTCRTRAAPRSAAAARSRSSAAGSTRCGVMGHVMSCHAMTRNVPRWLDAAMEYYGMSCNVM